MFYLILPIRIRFVRQRFNPTFETNLFYFNRDYVRGGTEGALAPTEFGDSEKRTERETDNLLLIAPRNQNPNVVPAWS